ncbi:hypothetical protein M0657_003189 [Pyricularia oryzae]|nr:hypothetical protein M0657_003189 [Pyricularia oryzae]KAI7928237.1 hypothetical protein M9X92_001925 [Pyricularia oryzae]
MSFSARTVVTNVLLMRRKVREAKVFRYLVDSGPRTVATILQYHLTSLLHPNLPLTPGKKDEDTNHKDFPVGASPPHDDPRIVCSNYI